MRIKLTPEQRFWALTDPCRTDGCAIWLGSVNRLGYGRFAYNKETILAHHFLVGKPPKGLEWDHKCHTPGCVWPDDLELVTHGVNVRRGNAGKVYSARTHCPRGHAYDEANTYMYRGYRACKTCRDIASRAWKQRQH